MIGPHYIFLEWSNRFQLQITPTSTPLKNCTIGNIDNRLEESAKLADRQKEVKAFNQVRVHAMTFFSSKLEFYEIYIAKVTWYIHNYKFTLMYLIWYSNYDAIIVS